MNNSRSRNVAELDLLVTLDVMPGQTCHNCFYHPPGNPRNRHRPLPARLYLAQHLVDHGFWPDAPAGGILPSASASARSGRGMLAQAEADFTVITANDRQWPGRHFDTPTDKRPRPTWRCLLT